MCGKNIEKSLDEKMKELESDIKKWQDDKQERLQRGEEFNILSVIEPKIHKERLHSLFIAWLLNPEGSHGRGSEFLKLFLEECKKVNSNLEVDKFTFSELSSKPTTESPFIYSDESNNEVQYGRLDIFLEEKEKAKAIIIENKVYARIDTEQLKLYRDFANKHYEHSCLILLSLREPEITESFDFIKITYNGLNSFLDSCIRATSSGSIQVCKEIEKYKELIDELMKERPEKKYKHSLIKDYDDSSIDDLVKIKVFEELIRLKIKATKEDVNINLHEQSFKTGRIDFSVSKNNNTSYPISIHGDSGSGWNNMFIGVYEESKEESIKCSLKTFYSRSKPNKSWPYGFEYLKYGDWQGNNLPDLFNGKVLDEIEWFIQSIFEEMEKCRFKYQVQN